MAPTPTEEIKPTLTNGDYADGSPGPSNRNYDLVPNGLDSEPWTSQLVAAAHEAAARDAAANEAAANRASPRPPPMTLAELTTFNRSWERVRLSLRTAPQFHQIVPEDILTAPADTRSFLEYPVDMVSVEPHKLRYLGVLKSLDPAGTAVVRTLRRCDVECSTSGCEGSGRLTVGQLVQLRHHQAGRHAGTTFIQCAASESTPVGDWALSRAASREPSRGPSPDPSPGGGPEVKEESE